MSLEEWVEEAQNWHGRQDFALESLGLRSVHDDDVAAIDGRVFHLAPADADQVEGGGHALAIDLAEDGDPPRIGRVVGAARHRDRLNERQRAIDRIHSGLPDRAVDGDVAARRGLDADADVRRLQIFGAELARQLLVELGGGEIDRLDVAEQRDRDMTGEVDLELAGQVLDLEDVDLERVERPDRL